MTQVVRKLLEELDHRFHVIRSPMNAKFDPIFLLATLLDPRYAELLDGDLLNTAQRELKLMVRFSLENGIIWNAFLIACFCCLIDQRLWRPFAKQ